MNTVSKWVPFIKSLSFPFCEGFFFFFSFQILNPKFFLFKCLNLQKGRIQPTDNYITSITEKWSMLLLNSGLILVLLCFVFFMNSVVVYVVCWTDGDVFTFSFLQKNDSCTLTTDLDIFSGRLGVHCWHVDYRENLTNWLTKPKKISSKHRRLWIWKKKKQCFEF